MSRGALVRFLVLEGRSSMAQLVTERGRWRIRRALLGLMAVVVGAVLLQVTLVVARRVVPGHQQGGVAELRGA
jgi:hypothetical protein